MAICPIAIAVGCKKCPAFKFCPLTTVLGDQAVGAWEEDSSIPTEHLDKIHVVTHEGMKNPNKCAFDDKYQKFTKADLPITTNPAEEELEKNKNEESKKE